MKKVVVTGASGFVGSCVVEALFAAGGYEIVANGRRPGAGGRVARFGCRLHVADLVDSGAVVHLVSGADAVVHCAFGGDSNQEQATRILLDAAANAGVRTFIHVSSTEVYEAQDGTLDEESPIQSTGDGYGAVKGRIEAVVRTDANRFPSLVILRPAIIYGPLSEQWTVAPIRRLLSGWKPRAQEMRGAANLVHIADVCRTIRECLNQESGGLRVYNVVGPEVVAWSEYFERLASALGKPPAAGAAAASNQPKAELGFVRTMLRVLPTSFRRRLTDLVVSVPVGAKVVARWRRMNFLNLTPAEKVFYARGVRYSAARLDRDGLAPRVGLDEGVRHCVEWARMVGLSR